MQISRRDFSARAVQSPVARGRLSIGSAVSTGLRSRASCGVSRPRRWPRLAPGSPRTSSRPATRLPAAMGGAGGPRFRCGPEREIQGRARPARGRSPGSASLDSGSVASCPGCRCWKRLAKPAHLRLAPISIFVWRALRRPSGNRDAPSVRSDLLIILLDAAWLFLTWWALTHRIDRFWVPMLPILATLAGVSLDWIVSGSAVRPAGSIAIDAATSPRISLLVVVTLAATTWYHLHLSPARSSASTGTSWMRRWPGASLKPRA